MIGNFEHTGNTSVRKQTIYVTGFSGSLEVYSESRSNEICRDSDENLLNTEITVFFTALITFGRSYADQAIHVFLVLLLSKSHKHFFGTLHVSKIKLCIGSNLNKALTSPLP